MNWASDWPAPAKLNLFLHIVGRRVDGYHLLQTVFRFIDLADTLRFEPRTDGRIVLATPMPGVPPEQNLVVRAAEALKRSAAEFRSRLSPVSEGARPELKVGAPQGLPSVAGGTASALGATIHLVKRIPQGGGLGGGSSDAATTLIALNHLWGCDLSRTRLQEIGLGLGADVPIFIHGRNCFAEGVGERFTEVAVVDECYLLAMPPVHVPTEDIFRAPNLKRDAAKIRPAEWRHGFGCNAMEPVAAALHPAIARCLAELRRFGDARMTGSGACCFVGFPTQAEAEAACRKLPEDCPVQVVPGIPVHPLLKTK
jgi:4-diphosphocytidyl-2-C-methyl-D-erythritol kinase